MNRGSIQKGIIFLLRTGLDIEGNNMHPFAPEEIGLGELGGAIRKDADVGHGVDIGRRPATSISRWVILPR